MPISYLAAYPPIPNQCWSGYYNRDTFASSSLQYGPVANTIKFEDFGVSILKYGCAVCCCIGATNYLNKNKTGFVPITVYDMYKKNAFVWNKNIVNSNGQSCGATLAKWNSTPGVQISNSNIHYDSDREYSFSKKNSAYSATPELTSAQVTTYSNMFYIPVSTDTAIYKSSYHNSLDDDFKAYQSLGFSRIKANITSGYVDIIYICNKTHNTGHYVLAYSFNSNLYTNRGNQYAADEINVVDPCPNSYNKSQYYGVATTLAVAMKRINSDISDGIRTVATVKSTL